MNLTQSLALAITAVGLGLSSISAKAQLTYDYVDFSYGSLELGTIDGDILAMNGSLGFRDNLSLLAGLEVGDYDRGIDTWMISGGAGYHLTIAENTDLIGNLLVVFSELDRSNAADQDDTGLGIDVGLRHEFREPFEAFFTLSRVDLFDDTESQVKFGLLYGGLAPNLSLGLSYLNGDALDGLYLTARWYLR